MTTDFTELSDSIQETNDVSFESDVILNPEPTLVFFVADWSCACKLAIPRFEAYRQRYQDVRIRKVNVETSPATSCRYQVTTLPTAMLFIEGQPRHVHRGAVNRHDLEEMFQLIPPPDD